MTPAVVPPFYGSDAMRSLMKNAAICGIGMGMLAMIQGCGSSPPPYPTGATSPAMTDGSMQPTATMTVPPGAEKLAQGPYDKVSFPVKQEPGLYFVYDVTAGKVVAETSFGTESYGKQMTMSDLKNVTHDTDSSHEYRISFTKQHMMTPATMPAGAQ
jgi:hypothetical protein